MNEDPDKRRKRKKEKEESPRLSARNGFAEFRDPEETPHAGEEHQQVGKSGLRIADDEAVKVKFCEVLDHSAKVTRGNELLIAARKLRPHFEYAKYELRIKEFDLPESGLRIFAVIRISFP